MNTCYNPAMATDKPKKVLTVPVKVDDPTKRAFEKIGEAEDRPLGYVVRELAVRGMALYAKDGKLRDTDAEKKPRTIKSRPVHTESSKEGQKSGRK